MRISRSFMALSLESYPLMMDPLLRFVSGPPVTWFFKFDNAETAVFGTKKDVLDAPFRLRGSAAHPQRGRAPA